MLRLSSIAIDCIGEDGKSVIADFVGLNSASSEGLFSFDDMRFQGKCLPAIEPGKEKPGRVEFH